jgi:predicted RNA-binding protein
MCLAKAYVREDTGDLGTRLLMENVTRVIVEGDLVRLTSLLGDAEELSGRITGIDFTEGRLMLQSTGGGSK